MISAPTIRTPLEPVQLRDAFARARWEACREAREDDALATRLVENAAARRVGRQAALDEA